MARSTVVWMLLLGLAASTWGCARQEQTTQSDTAVPTDDASITDAPGSDADPSGPEQVAPADTNAPVSGTLTDLRSRLRSEAQRLDRAVTAGNLEEVGAIALRLRDAAVALSGKTSSLPAQSARDAEAQLTHVVQATETIRTRAAAGEIAGIRTENAQLQEIVEQVMKFTAGTN